MVHARNVKPPVAGATLQRIDESSVADVPGFIRVVSSGNYVAVVCEREEQAIRAAAAAEGGLEEAGDRAVPDLRRPVQLHAQAARPRRRASPRSLGDPDAALAGAARVVEADYEVPFQGHTAIGPAHALADPSNGQMTIYSNDMKSYGLRNGVATVPRTCRARRCASSRWTDRRCTAARPPTMPASRRRSWRRSSAARCACSGCATRKRRGTPRGRRYVFKLRGGLDAQGKLVALDYDVCAADYNHLGYNEPDTVLIAQLMGKRPANARRARPRRLGDVRHSESAHDHAGRRAAAGLGNAAAHRQPARSQRPAGDVRFRVVHRRTCSGRKGRSRWSSASTCWQQGKDDAGFRKARSIAVVKAAAKRLWLGHATVAASARNCTRGNVLTGRGIAYTYRSKTVVAVDRRGRGESPDRARLGEAPRLRARLRTGHQPRGAAPHGRVRHAARVEPRAVGRSAVRQREGHQRRLGYASEPAAFGYAGRPSTSCWSTAIPIRIVRILPRMARARAVTSP